MGFYFTKKGRYNKKFYKKVIKRRKGVGGELRKYLFIGIILSMIILLFLQQKNHHSSPYHHYRKWYNQEIALVMDAKLKIINQKIKDKKVGVEDYENLAKTYEILHQKALNKKDSRPVHKQLILYLEKREQYHKGYANYYKNKDQLAKAKLNNIYDEGNTHYMLFLDELEKFANVKNEKFEYPFGLY